MLGGGEHSFLDLMSHLPNEWHVSSVLPHEGELAVRLKKRGLETFVISLPSIRPWLSAHIYISLRDYLNLCRNHRPTLIYANGSRAAFYGGIIGQILKVPVIWHCRIAETDPCFDFLLTRLSNKIVVNSRATARRFKSKFQQKIEVVYNGVDIEWMTDMTVEKPKLIQADWKVILMVARASRWKRHDLALSAFEQIAKSDQRVHMVCIGAQDRLESEWWAHLQERTRHSPFSNRIHWIGQQNDVRPWYRIASLLVLASENEPFGRVLVEAMACGVPVVATRGGGVSEIIQHGRDGLLVESGKYEEMAEAIVQILKNNSLRETLACFGKKRAELFSIETHVARMVRIFDEITPS